MKQIFLIPKHSGDKIISPNKMWAPCPTHLCANHCSFKLINFIVNGHKKKKSILFAASDFTDFTRSFIYYKWLERDHYILFKFRFKKQT